VARQLMIGAARVAQKVQHVQEWRLFAVVIAMMTFQRRYSKEIVRGQLQVHAG
jgi:hypothetical protein